MSRNSIYIYSDNLECAVFWIDYLELNYVFNFIINIFFYFIVKQVQSQVICLYNIWLITESRHVLIWILPFFTIFCCMYWHAYLCEPQSESILSFSVLQMAAFLAHLPPINCVTIYLTLHSNNLSVWPFRF